MSNKTEQPTEKKKKDSAEKGQSWKSADLTTWLILFSACMYIYFSFPPHGAILLLSQVLTGNLSESTDAYTKRMFFYFYIESAKILLVVFLPAALPALILSRFRLAKKAIKIDFAAINPVSGFKRIFSLKTLKDGIKSLIYLGVYFGIAYFYWITHRHIILSLSISEIIPYIAIWAKLLFDFFIYFLLAGVFLVVIDILIEYFLYIKNIKMTKDEVKKEYKETEGNPQMKQERRRIGQEMLSEPVKSNIRQSSFVMANPTHIAIGIYINLDISPLPFVSLIEVNQRALMVIAYAEAQGIPVVRDRKNTQALYKTIRKYDFVPMESVSFVTEVMKWLIDVETARLNLSNVVPDDN